MILYTGEYYNVLQNRFNTDNKISVYPFSQFENEIKRFLDKETKKGLLFIDHADFSFSDTSCYYTNT
jgi:hypothetical protein